MTLNESKTGKLRKDLFPHDAIHHQFRNIPFHIQPPFQSESSMVPPTKCRKTGFVNCPPNKICPLPSHCVFDTDCRVKCSNIIHRA